jgi:hypothetical protein
MSIGGGPQDESFLIGPFLDWWDRRTAKRDAKRTAKLEAKATQRAGRPKELEADTRAEP